jgi:hypothetical protein
MGLRAPLLALLVVVTALSSACRFGQARFEGKIDDRTFDPAGTAFAYVDQRGDDLVEDPRPRVVVVLTWLVFNPESDLNDLSGPELEAYAHELELRDAMTLVFDDQGTLQSGVEMVSVREGAAEIETGPLTAVVHMAPDRLDAQSSFGDFAPFGSKRTTTVTLSAVDFRSDNPHLAGEVELAFAPTPSDPALNRQGTYSGTFDAPVVNERVAESNLSLLDVQDILEVPLAARPVVQ